MKLPNGPQALPFLQLIQWIARPIDYMDACAQRYGDIFTARLGRDLTAIFISNPEAIQQIFTADPGLFDTSQGSQIMEPLLGSRSLILVDGERHQRQRRLLTPPFHGDRMRAYSRLICELTQQVTSQWRIGEPFSVRSSMQEISLRVILKAVFGLHEGPRYEQLRQLLGSVLESLSSRISSSLLFYDLLQRDLGPWSPWGRFLRQRQQIDQLIYNEIQERRAQPDSSRADILTLLMAAQDEAGQPMTDVELRDELMTLLIAGHETTASALTWAFYWIHRLPHVHGRLLKELDTLGEAPDPSEISRLPYLTAVCQETLRIYPIGMLAFPRITKSPIELMGYQFAPGTSLIPCIYLTHQRQDLYPEPKQFKPERFLERQFSPHEYLPFGGSNRRCIGLAFAQYEMKLVLARVLSRFQLALSDNHSVRPIRRGLTSAPSGGKWLVATGKRQPQLKRASVQV